LRVSGRALVVGDDVDTDTIIPARHLHRSDPAWLASHVFEDAPHIKSKLLSLEKPVVVVAGRGFGYGSSREHAALALKAAGVVGVVAESFHRIFFRNAVNNGLLVVEASLRGVRDRDLVTVDAESGLIEVAGLGAFKAKPLPSLVAKILRAGGLLAELKERAKKECEAL